MDSTRSSLSGGGAPPFAWGPAPLTPPRLLRGALAVAGLGVVAILAARLLAPRQTPSLAVLAGMLVAGCLWGAAATACVARLRAGGAPPFPVDGGLVARYDAITAARAREPGFRVALAGLVVLVVLAWEALRRLVLVV